MKKWKVKATKTAAIKFARNQVTCLYRFGGGWNYNSYDPKCKAWRVCSPESYWKAVSSRAREMLRHAVMYMGYDWEMAERLAYDLQNNGGDWRDYVPAAAEAGEVEA